MIIFVLVLISAFTLIQLQNQLTTITIFNSLRAKLSANIIKQTIQNELSRRAPSTSPKDAIDAGLASMQELDLLATLSVYNASGIVESSTRSFMVGRQCSSFDKARISEMLDRSSKEQKIVSHADKDTRVLQMFIPIKDNGNVAYITKLDMPLGNIEDAFMQVYKPVILTSTVVAIATIFFGLILSRRVIGPIKLLNAATKEVAGGDLNLRIHMDTGDELGEMANTFNLMAIELKKMRQKAENANPLTKLPGNIVIQEESEKRIENNDRFMVIYCDLDHFKAFNDKYGIHKGDDAIKLTAEIFKEAVQNTGNTNDFIGHEGGDDFILLTTPDKAQEVSDYITSEFDKRIRFLYDKDDLERGYIEAKARHGEEILKYPIMTISLAGVTNETRTISSYAEITNIAAEVKKKAKKTPGSCLVIDRRKGERDEEEDSTEKPEANA
jgi:diguanylate cyclase (GGDEF)-like protein